MSEHTTGKLTVVDNSWEVSSIYDESRQCVALCHIYPGAKEGAQDENAIRKEANARRLVAAWNACAGATTEDLESHGFLAMRTRQVESLEAERDSLRAVNAELLAFANEWLERQGTDNNYMTEKARAAIASARKQENQHG